METCSLGKDTGSLVNYMYGNMTGQPKPTVGMGCTVLMWTDRHAATIVDVNKSGKTIKIQRDIAERVDTNGMSEGQEYTFKANPNAPVETFTLRKNGFYVQKGDSANGCKLFIGTREEYYDFSF